jgi:hypothetical protein
MTADGARMWILTGSHAALLMDRVQAAAGVSA